MKKIHSDVEYYMIPHFLISSCEDIDIQIFQIQ